MAHDVFISHSNTDRTVANAVCAILEQAGIRCWMAPRDIVPGKSWAGEIVRAISETKVMVLIFTGEANRSPQILREVERAVGHRVVILPFKVEDVVPAEDLEYFISSQHWLDAVTPPMEQHIDYLARTVRRVLEDSGRAIPEAHLLPPRDPAHRAGDVPSDKSPPRTPADPPTVSTLLGLAGSSVPPVRDRVPEPVREIRRDAPGPGSTPVPPRTEEQPRKWLIPAAAAAAVLLVALGWFAMSNGDDEPKPAAGVSTDARIEAELTQIENERQAADRRRNDTDSRAYIAADSILAAAVARLSAVSAAVVPTPLQPRVAQLDSTLRASRASLRTACRSEQAIAETTTTECPGE